MKLSALKGNNLSRNTLVLLISNIGSAVLSFLLSVLIGRALGKDGLGVYSTALAWIFPLSLIAEFGLGSLMTRDLAQNPQAAPDYLRITTTLRLWLGGGLMLAVAASAALFSSNPAIIAGLQISAPLIIILPLFGAFTAVFRAQQVMWPIPWLNLGMLVIQVGLTAWILANGGGVASAFIVNTLTSAGQLTTAWWIYRRWFVNADQTQLAAHLQFRLLIRQAWPFALAAVLAALQTRIGTILLERLTDVQNVGDYAAATRFVEAGRMIPNALFGALFPMLAALAATPHAMQRTFRQVMAGLTAFSFVLGIGGLLFASLAIRLTYGEKFQSAVPVLQLALWSLLPSLLRAGQTLYWYAVKREQFVNWVMGVMVALQAAFSIWLIPNRGAWGATLASLITESIGLGLLLWPIFRQRSDD